MTAGPPPPPPGGVITTLDCLACRGPVYMRLPTIPPMTDLAALGWGEQAPTVELDIVHVRLAAAAHHAGHHTAPRFRIA